MRWGVRGVKLVQTVEREYVWRYLVVAVNPLTGAMRWAWVERLQGASLAGVAAGWQASGDVGGLVWDGAAVHRSARVREVGVPRWCGCWRIGWS
ncbi:MAG: hypothetical protein NZ556_08140, partial [Fimbriimonadales bacterium]|nr:hypothetical protein [Fimbriimonadales bacterium]